MAGKKLTLAALLQVNLLGLLVWWVFLGIFFFGYLAAPLDVGFYAYLVYALIVVLTIISAHRRSRGGLLFYVLFDVTVTTFHTILLITLLTAPSAVPLTAIRSSSNNTSNVTNDDVDTFTQYLFDHLQGTRASNRRQGYSPPGAPPIQPARVINTVDKVNLGILFACVCVMKIICVTLAIRLVREITTQGDDVGDDGSYVELATAPPPDNTSGPYYVQIEPTFTAQPIYPGSDFP